MLWATSVASASSVLTALPLPGSRQDSANQAPYLHLPRKLTPFFLQAYHSFSAAVSQHVERGLCLLGLAPQGRRSPAEMGNKSQGKAGCCEWVRNESSSSREREITATQGRIKKGLN